MTSKKQIISQTKPKVINLAVMNAEETYIWQYYCGNWCFFRTADIVKPIKYLVDLGAIWYSCGTRIETSSSRYFSSLFLLNKQKPRSRLIPSSKQLHMHHIRMACSVKNVRMAKLFHINQTENADTYEERIVSWDILRIRRK